MRLSFQPQIQSDTTHLSETSSKILRLISGVPCNVSETLSIFFHSILAWNQEICTIPMIFRHCMLFLVFFERPCTRLWSSFLIKMLQLLSSFAHMASVLIQVHKYQISINWFRNFDPLLILNLLRWIIPRKQKKLKENSKPINKIILCY